MGFDIARKWIGACFRTSLTQVGRYTTKWTQRGPDLHLNIDTSQGGERPSVRLSRPTTARMEDR